MFSTPQILLLISLFYIVMTRHLDFRERFLERKRLRTLKDQRIKVFNKFVLKNTEMLDDITHYRKLKGKSLKKSKKARSIEKDFRRLLAMNGMKYNYKRDMFWRTWRTMPPVNNATDQIVTYKCNNPVLANATACQNCGMWTIEDKPPPCPFEFFSLISADKLCGVDYKQYKDENSTCPSVIKFSDMIATCENPIETQWRFTKMYGINQKYDDVICKNEDVCDILTLYEISPKHVVFRIINATNDVIYSRIMKPKNRNYICVKDCGRFNPNTRKVTKVDNPLKMNLLVKRKRKKAKVHKKMKEKITKRNILNEKNELVTERSLMNESGTKRNLLNKSGKKINVLNEMNEHVKKRNVLNEIHENGTKNKVLNDVNESATKGGVFLEDIRLIVTKRAVSNENNNYDMHGTCTIQGSKEDLNEEVQELSSQSDSDYIIVSIEENVLHNTKSRKKKKKLNTVVSTEEVTLRPTVTPGPNLLEGGPLSIEELEDEEFE